MKNKKRILITIIISTFVVGIILLFINLFKENNDKKNTIQNEKKEYYDNMQKRMLEYYKIKYKFMSIPESKKYSIIRINLVDLKNDGFPMDEFVSYDEKNECDLYMSYASRKIINSKYVIDVYYKCGTDANYDYQNIKTTKKTAYSNGTTKKHSISVEEFEANKSNNITTKNAGGINE